MKTIRALLSTFMVLWICALPALAVGYYATTSATSIAVAIPPGTAGNVMTSTGTTWASAAPAAVNSFQTTSWGFWDDCVSGVDLAAGAVYISSLTSGGSISDAAAETGHPGIYSLNADASTDNSAAFLIGSTRQFLFGGGVMRCCSIIKTPALSDVTDGYTITGGFADSTNPITCTDGAFFKYSDDVNSGKWQLVARTNSAETTADSGVAVVADTWYKLEVEINAAGTLGTYYINDVSVGTLAAVPAGAGRQTGFNVGTINKTDGTNNRILLIDAGGVKQTLTTAR